MRYDAAVSAGALLGMLAAGPALAGVVITLDDTNLTTQTTRTQTVSADPQRLRVDGAKTLVIFRGDLQKAWVIDLAKASYYEFTPQSMQQMHQGVDAMMAERLKNVPEAQRAQIQAMMAQRGGGMPPGAPPTAPPQPATYEKSGETRTVGQWTCDVYHKKVNGQLESDLCIAPLAAVGVTRADFQGFQDMGKFFGTMMGRGPTRSDLLDFDAQTSAIGFEGFPVETVSYVAGKPSSKHDIKSIDHKALPPDSFELPAGLTQKDMPGMGAGRPGGGPAVPEPGAPPAPQ